MSDATGLDWHAMGDGRRIAQRHSGGKEPAVVFLPGYMSDMSGAKATAVFTWAQAQGHEALLLDYSGCGESTGDFALGTISRWTEEVVAMIQARSAGEVVLVGSSMGGWIMLHAALALGDRVAGLVGVAAAPDFTEWGFGVEEKQTLAAGETLLRDNPYGPEPTPTHAAFWRDGQDNRLLESEIAIDAPVRLLHGQRDEDVPFETSLRLAERLRSADVQVTLIKDGDHRLSRDSDIALLLLTVDALISGR